MVTKQELINFIDEFKGETITKQDVLDFMANSQVTKVFIGYYDFTINGGNKTNWLHADDLQDELSNVKFAKRVEVQFDTDESDIDREQTLAVIELFKDMGYQIEYVDTDLVKFVKA